MVNINELLNYIDLERTSPGIGGIFFEEEELDTIVDALILYKNSKDYNA